MQTLHIQLLGDFRLLYNDEPVNMAHLPRQQSLLAYLVLHRDAPQSRQQIAFLFWPDASEVRARANLRKTLYDLRRMILSLEHFVEIEDQYLQWRNSATTILDVELFVASLKQAEQATQANNQQEVAKAALEQAVALYRGDLLPACYDDWVLLEREQLRQHYVKALEQLIGLLEQQRELLSALAYGQRLLLCDSLHESTYRLLMRLHVLNGDRATALRVYHTCVTILQQELGVDPSPETQQLYAHLLHLPTEPTVQIKTALRAPKGQLSLVGRQSEWQMLLAAWHAAASGTAHCVLIAGEAGIGKTRLAEEMVQWAERQGYATARTRSYAAEGRLAYAPITDWLHAPPIRSRLQELEPVWLVEVARLLPELLVARPELPPPAPLADSWQRQRFRDALARAITLSHQPLLLVIDDLQWCDNETLEWIHYLLRFAAQEPLLVVGTMRAEEAAGNPSLTTLLMNLRHADQLSDIELGYLSSAETATLASQITDDALSREQSVALYAQSEGHPLFIVEMVRASGKMGAVSEQAAIPASSALPPKVQAVIRSRLAQLSPSAQELVGLAATVGRAFTLDVLIRASDNDEDTLVRALDELWQRRLIREQGEHSYDFSHDKLRDVAYARISPARRRLLHRRVAQALEHLHASDFGAVSGQIAAHYESAGQPEKAVSYYLRAGYVAQQIYAHTDAVHYFGKGVALLHKLPVTKENLRLELVQQLAMGVSVTAFKGVSVPEARTIFARAQDLALQLGDDPMRLSALIGLIDGMLTSGQVKEGNDLAKQGVDLAQQIGEASGLIDAFRRLSVSEGYQGQWRASCRHFEQILTEYQWNPLRQLWEHYQLLIVRQHYAVTLWHLGYPSQSEEQIKGTVAMVQALDHLPSETAALCWSAWLHHFRREPAYAQAHAAQAIVLASRLTQPYWLAHCLIIEGWAFAQQGQLEAGIARMKEGLATRLAMGAHLHRPAFLAMLAETYGQVDQPQQALQLLNEALEHVESTGESMSEAELYRLKGEMLHIQGADEHEVEACFLQALAIARQQEAKLLELRAAMSMSRLWQKQGRAQEAHALLAEIYGWFREGFDTADLVEARALLEELF